MDTTILSFPWATADSPQHRRPSADTSVLFIALVLALVGLIMVFSASAVVAGSRFQDPIYFLKRQVAWLAFGLALLYTVSRVNYTVWRKLVPALLGITVVLLIAVWIPTIGLSSKGARRWIRLGIVSVQPAELAKVVSVLYLAAYLAKKEALLSDFTSGLLPPLIVIGLLAGLIVVQPDLGTVVVMGLVTLLLLYLAGARLHHLGSLLLLSLPTVAILIMTSPYRRQRLLSFLSPWNDAADAGFQVTQSFLAFGSGGLFGVGLGEGRQKLFFLPEAHTDFVLALIGEELGLVGSIGIMLLFVILVLKGFQIAGRAREPFGRHLALGITLLIGGQALINAGVVTGLLPTKGLTLPLVSYGGSSLMTSLFGVGLLLSISRDRRAGSSSGMGGAGLGGTPVGHEARIRRIKRR
jgi:cell division protein FtsW